MGSTMLLLLIPLIAWILIAKLLFRHEFTFEEMVIQFGITAIILISLTFVGYSSMTSDEMAVNGVVTKIKPRKESCNMYWSDYRDDFCTNYRTRQVRNGETCTTVNNKRSCTPRYKTQFKSVYPWEQRYFVESTVSGYEIDRVDRQGVDTPPRFASIKIGDPVTMMVPYTNYIKGAASSLFNQKLEDVPLVAYPQVYDYYHVDRVFYTDLASPPFIWEWNRDLERINAGFRGSGANVIINVTSKHQVWAETLSQSWDAHNINDVVITIGVQGEKIAWVDVRDWSSDKMLSVVTRDLIMLLPRVDKDMINQIIGVTVPKHYKPQKMEDFEYLADDTSAPTWLFVVVGIILLIITPATTWFLSNNDRSSLGYQISHFAHRNKRF